MKKLCKRSLMYFLLTMSFLLWGCVENKEQSNINQDVVMADESDNGENFSSESSDEEVVASEIKEEKRDNQEIIIKPEDAKIVIESISNQVIEFISIKDFEGLSKFIHPVSGARFTPDTYVLLDKDLVFEANEIHDFFRDSTEYIWGAWEGSVKPMNFTKEEYYNRFIYNLDYKNADEILFNEFQTRGAMDKKLLTEIYPESIIVEYYFDEEWESLRIVYQEFEGTWYIIGFMHFEATI